MYIIYKNIYYIHSPIYKYKIIYYDYRLIVDILLRKQ